MLAEVCRGYGWTKRYAWGGKRRWWERDDSLTSAEFFAFAQELQMVLASNHLTLLGIATNPHLKEKKQRDLWKAFERIEKGPPQLMKQITPDHKKQADDIVRAGKARR